MYLRGLMTNDSISSQISDNKNELVKKLHKDMNANFLNHTIYDINDSLASILALCDMEHMGSLDRVKRNIERINGLLGNVRIYQDITKFNVNHVLNNVIDIIKDNFQDTVDIKYSSIPLKALAESDQLKFEHILLSILTDLILSDTRDVSEISISLTQKDRGAYISIINKASNLSVSSFKDISSLNADFSGRVELKKSDDGIRFLISIPLTFKKSFSAEPTSSIQLSVTQLQKAYGVGAQERT
jgi:hypothetical protein